MKNFEIEIGQSVKQPNDNRVYQVAEFQDRYHFRVELQYEEAGVIYAGGIVDTLRLESAQ